MKRMGLHALTAAAMMACATSAMAWHIEGYVYCDDGDREFGPGDSPLAGIRICVTGVAGGASDGFESCVETDANGYYFVRLLDVEAEYCAEIDGDTVPNGAAVIDPSQPYCFESTWADWDEDRDWLIDHLACTSPCWMTAGGVKFEPICGEELAQGKNGNGPADSFGGNVYPSCSAFPGDGGHWNHVVHSLNLHLNGQTQRVIQCGNFDGQTGTESPECDVNFIEWEGWGTVSPIRGGDTEKKTPVYYLARVEDHNEPGNEKAAKDQPEDLDRYFIAVWAIESGELLFQYGTLEDPLSITGGNLQIHCTSCD